MQLALALRFRRTAVIPTLYRHTFARAPFNITRSAFSSTIAQALKSSGELQSQTSMSGYRPRRGGGRGGNLGFSARNETEANHLSPRNTRAPVNTQRPVDPQRNSKKRKRDDDNQSRRPAARRRTDTVVMQYDMASIRRNMKLPTRAEFPRMPKQIDQNPKGVLHNSLRRHGKFATRFNMVSGSHHQCIVTSEIDSVGKLEVTGEGAHRRQAESAAFLHLLARLYEAGILGELWDSGPERLSRETLKEEKDAKLDIYDYAAKYHCIPSFTVTDGSKHSRLRKQRKSVAVTIQMPEQGIDVTGTATTKEMAEIAAALKFKKAAENYHSSQGTDALVVKDSSSLSVANARMFFEFYKDVDKHAEFTLDLQGKGGSFSAQVILNNEPFGEKVHVVGTKKKVEDLAFLVAAVKLTKEDDELLPRFLKALRAGNGQILRMVPPIDVEIDQNAFHAMEDTLLAAKRAGLRDNVDDLEVEDKRVDSQHRPRPAITGDEAKRRSKELKRAHEEYRSNPELESLRKQRAELPMSQYASKVLDIVDNNIYSIIIGATGSGKTTQVPQILLDRAIESGDGASCNIVCTQPRRIAATSVARRVADERGEKLQFSVGYHVRFDPKIPRPGGSVTYCTTGILLQQLQHNPDDVLDKVSHLVIDEVHERDMLIDFLLIVLKKVMARRAEAGKSVPKVVLMSATIDSELFASYFKNTHLDGDEIDCPTLSVPGRTFPVKEQYLENILQTLDESYGSKNLQVMYKDRPSVEYVDYEKTFARDNPVANGANGRDQADDEAIIDWKKKAVVSANGEITTSTENEDALVPAGLVATTIAHIAKTTDEGAILVFLPGLEEMVEVKKMLEQQNPLGVDFKDESTYKTYMLHSSIQDSQRSVFDPVPEGCRKIILGTNIAETSITIPDVQYVVDTGKLREKRYDQIRRITKLQCTWVSKSNSKQRAGRAGRVQNGHYYALFSRSRFHNLRAIGLPELLRSDLQETCLDVKSQAFQTPVRQFLADAIEPPSPVAVENAVENLITLDALTEDEELTALGRLLSQLPVHPSLGKMIVLGMIFRCLDPMIVLGAAAGERNLFVSPMEARNAARDAKIELSGDSNSDHLATLNAFSSLREAERTRGFGAMKELAHRKFLHGGAYSGINSTAKQIEGILVDAGLVPKHGSKTDGFGGPTLNENSKDQEMIKALALAGMHPNLGLTTNNMLFRTAGEKNCMVHPSSVNGAMFGRDKDPKERKIQTRDPKLVTYTTLAKSNDGHSTFIRDATIVDPLMAMLFGGRLYSDKKGGRLLEMDGWLQFWLHSRARNAHKIMLDFRKGLDRMQIEAFRDLSKKESIADNKVRSVFAKGLSEILAGAKHEEMPLSLDRGPSRMEWGLTTMRRNGRGR